MFKVVTVISVLFIITSSVNTLLADSDQSNPIPLPDMEDGSHICGTMILFDLIDPDDLENGNSYDQQQLIDPEDEPEVGDRETFHVANFEDSQLIDEYDQIEFELRAISNKSEIWVEVDEIGEDKINDEVVSDILNEQDEQTAEHSWNPNAGILDVGQKLFGSPPDFDDSGPLKTLIVDIQDGWDPDEGGGFVAGFFNPADQSLVHPNSNQADIIYINSYPGIYFEDQEPDASRRFGAVAHEYQHLIHIVTEI